MSLPVKMRTSKKSLLCHAVSLQFTFEVTAALTAECFLNNSETIT